MKAQLEAMPAPEVARLAAASMARQQAQHQAKLKTDAAAKRGLVAKLPEQQGRSRKSLAAIGAVLG